MRNYYEILGITSKAPTEIVTAVYRAWMHALKVHPDLGGDEELAKTINHAYETLKDPLKRATYDEKIKTEHAEVRRRAGRFTVDAKIAFCIPPDGRWLAAQAVDASSLGIKLYTNEDLFVGLHVAIAFPESASPAVEAVVRWTKTTKARGVWRHESGVEFFNPVPDILHRLGGSKVCNP